MALVPESWLHRNFIEEKDGERKPTTEVTVMPETKEDEDVKSMIELLPKMYQSKARIIMHYLEGHVKLDKNQRIVYAGGMVGSHVLDLLRYFISPLVKERPLDAPRFLILMKAAGVPQSAIARKGGVMSKWKTYK